MSIDFERAYKLRGIVTRRSRHLQRAFDFQVSRVSIILITLLLVAAVIGLAAAGGGVASGAAPALRSAPSSTTQNYGHRDRDCGGVINGHAWGSLTKSTSAGPNGSSVLPGQTITVTLQWNPRDFGGHNPSVSEDCVMIGSHISHSLSQVHVPGPSGGTDTFTYVVPSQGTDGQQICDRGVLLADGDGDGDGNGGGGWSGWGGGGGWGQGTDSQHEGGEQQQQKTATSLGQGGNWQDDGDGHVEKSAVLCYTVQAAAAPEAPMAVMFPVAGLIVGGASLLVYRRRRRLQPAI